MDLRHLEAFATKTDNQRIMFGTPSFQETSPSEDDRWSKYVEVQEGRWEHYRPRESQGIPREHKAYFLSWILVWAIWPRYIHSDGLPEESARKKTRMVEFPFNRKGM